MGKLISEHNSDLQAEFWHLWTQEREHLLLLCRKWMGNPEDAEDALSSAMIKAWEKLPRFQDKIINLRAWLTRFLYNHCMDLHRARRREPGGEQSIEELVGRDREGPGMQESPEEEMVRREMFNHLRAAIRELPSALRQPISLRLFRELPYREIARELNMTPENARKRVQRARRLISRQLEQLPDHLRKSEDLIPESELLGESPRVSELPLPGNFAHPVAVRQANPWRWLEVRPGRLAQKQQTLEKYVLAHPGGWRKRFELAETLVALGEAKSATSQLHAILEKRPETHQARILLFELFLEAGKGEAAAGAATAGAAHSRNPETRIFFEGLRRYAGGDLPDAVDAIREAFLLSPSKVLPGWWLARLFGELEAHSEAFDVLEHVREEKPDIQCINYLFIDYLLKMGRMERARSGFRSLDPESVSQPAFSLLEARFAGIWFQEDRERLMKSLQRNFPGHPETLRAQALLGLAKGSSRKWERNMKADLKKSSAAQALRLVWLEHALWRGEYPAVFRWIRQKSSRGSDDFVLRAIELLAPHALPKEIIQKLLSWIHSLSGWRRYTWGAMLLAQLAGREEQALRWAFEGRDLQPRLVQSWWVAGKLLFQVGRKSEALDFFRNAKERCGQEDHGLMVVMDLEIAGVYHSVGDAEAHRYLNEVEVNLPHAAFELPGFRTWISSRVERLAGRTARAEELLGKAISEGLPYPWRSPEHQ